jgi:uncharacterized protein YlxP (DUF503 family)
VYVAALSIDLYLRESRSLKAKRALVKPVVEGMRRRFHVSAAEVGQQNTWQRAALGVAVVASSEAHARDICDEVERFVWSFPEIEVLRIERQWLEVAR